MHPRTKILVPGCLLIFGFLPLSAAPQQRPAQQIDLARSFDAGKLRTVNRDVSKIADRPDGLHVSERSNPGVIWIKGSDFAEGSIEVDVRGRDQLQRSFLGIAFHGKDDNSYEAVYLRPFNFRAADAVRHRHALQYMALPDFDWPRLRELFPDEFEAPVNPSVSPTGWTTLRVVVHERNIEVYVGADKTPALKARKLENLNGGMVGLWTGNESDGDFANLRITPAK